MKKVIEFFKSKIIIIKWTIEYFAILSLLLWFLFHFNVFSAHHWWKFSHATLHGFGGLVFGLMMYSAIPIYIATTLIIYRKQEPIIIITVPAKIKNFLEKIKSIFVKPAPEPAKESTSDPTPTPDSETTPEYPSDMPPELYIPYIRAKQNIPLTGAISVFNKQKDEQTTAEPQQNETQTESFPIPSDFDISDSLPTTETRNDEFPIFRDLDFDTPIEQPKTEKLSNNTTKYFDENHTEYETYHEFIATEKYVIYEHNDDDFWIMDDDNWFATNKQHESPIPELLDLARQNDLIPVLYLESQNIMDLTGTIEKFESNGIRVIKSLNELK